VRDCTIAPQIDGRIEFFGIATTVAAGGNAG
jgi:hypothetical protein